MAAPRFEKGYLRLGTLSDIPIRIHWATPLAMVLLGRFQLVPVFWAGLLLLVLIHELGHAAVVKSVGLRVTGIDLNPIGGLCHFTGMPAPFQRALIAWGGVWAQLAVLIPTGALLLIFGWPASWSLAQLAEVFTSANLFIAAVNLLPLPPLDGAEAWKLVPMLRARRKQSAAAREQKRRVDEATRAAQAEIERMDALEDELENKKKNGRP